MKLNAGNVTIGTAFLIGAFWTAALATDVDKNSVARLENEIRYLVNLRAEWVVKFPKPRPVELQKQMDLWAADIVKYQNALVTKRVK